MPLKEITGRVLLTEKSFLNTRFTRAHPLLHDLLILQTIKHKGLLYYVLHEGFKKGLRGALTGGGTTQSFGVTYKPRPNDGSVQVDLETLIDHGDTTWESLLKYMVSSQKRATAGLETPEPRVLDLLLQCGLMDHVEDDHHRRTELLKITSKGFQFLLEDRSAQIWQVLMYYIQQQGNMDREGPVLDGVEILKMLFTLSMMQLGRASHVSGLSVAFRVNCLLTFNITDRRTMHHVCLPVRERFWTKWRHLGSFTSGP